ncbi:hypothetical protein [Pseudomonas rhodesiae]|uniref:hypothetical protein n=1 Tax=Pseudomonas rhodesiae TaxID=76760 RepID=UPI0011B51D7F|nr:hypothetical protein [Pseudomonas rhodesiae]TWR51696.1 hypothetical protein FIV35_21985 [Pseudomonas rhodesiae]
MKISDAVASLSTPLSVSTPAAASSQSGDVAQPDASALESRSGPRMQNLGLTSLRQTVLQGLGDTIRSHVLPSLVLHSNDSSRDKAFGAALTFAGGMAKVAGKKMAGSGGLSSKVAGSALMWGGKAAEKIGKDTYKNAEPKDHGNYNAFAPRNWAR